MGVSRFRWIGSVAQIERSEKIEMRASGRLIETVPSTLDGAVAVLRYLRGLFERDEYSPIEDAGYRALMGSIERGIGGPDCRVG